jgi:DNA-binding transcriptional MocR family regulator
MAALHGVSPANVVSAYDQLPAQGLVEARPQRGLFARDLAQNAPHPSVKRSLILLKRSNLVALAAALTRHGAHPRHGRTGGSLTPAAAHRVLQLAQQDDFHVREDDTYAHLALEHAKRVSVLDGLQRMVYASGFRKILAPSWRVGSLAAPAALVDRLRQRLDAARARSVQLAQQAGCR